MSDAQTEGRIPLRFSHLAPHNVGFFNRLTIGVAYNLTMNKMNVQEMTDRLKVRYKRISPNHKSPLG